MDKRVLIATGNRHKFLEFQEFLRPFGFIALFGAEVCPALQVEENGNTFEQNAQIKAQAYASASGLMALADDSGIMVEALDGAPGIYSARYASTDRECRAKMLRELEGEKNRAAKFVAALCLCDSTGKVIARARGECKGSITTRERGDGDFGYDPIFVPDGEERTFAQMQSDEKALFSHRGAAFRALATQLTALKSDKN